MRKGLKRAFKITGIALGGLALILVAVLLLVLFNKSLVRNVLQSQLEKRTGMAVRIGRLDYKLFPLWVEADSIAVGLEDDYLKMDVALARLEAEGHLGRLVRGRRPAFDQIGLEGLEVRYVEKAVSPEPVDIGTVVRQAGDLAAQAEKIELKGGRVTASVYGQAVELEDVLVEMIPLDDGRPGRAFRFECGALRSAAGDGSYAAEGGFRAAGTVVPGPATAASLRAALLSPRVSTQGRETSLDSLLLEADGIWEMDEGRVSVSRLSVGVPGLMDVTGAAAAALKGPRSLEVFAAVRLADLARAAALFEDRLPPGFRGAKLRGRAGADIRYVLAGTPERAAPDLHVSLTLERVELDHAVSGIPLRASLEGGLEIDRLPVGFGVAADLGAALAAFSLQGIEVGRSALRIQGRADPERADLTRLEARVGGVTLPVAEERDIRFERAALTGRASIDLRAKTLDIQALRAALDPLPPFDLAGRLDLGGRGPGRMRLEAKGFAIPALREFLGPLVPAELAEWEAAGTFDLEARAAGAGPPGAGWEVAAALAFSEVAFNDPTFTMAGEGLSPALRLEATLAPPATALPFSMALALDRGESLFKAFYVSWAKHPVQVSLGGRYAPGGAAVENLKGNILLPTIGRADVSGEARLSPAPTVDLRLDARLAMAPFYSLYTQAGVAEESRMRLEGDLDAGLRIASGESGGLAVRGRLRLTDAALENPASKMLLTGMAADIPVHYDSAAVGSGAAAGEFPERGSLLIGDLQSPFLSLGGLEIGLGAGANGYLIDPLGVDLFGGRLETGPLTVRVDPAGGAVRGQGSLALRDLDISLFPIASPQFKLTGRVRAEFPSLSFTAERIAVSGRGEADMFGGQIVLRDLAVERPFSEGRTISLNVDLLDLDLKKLTDEVPFGEVTGIVRGEIRDLVLSYGQPERFDFRLESVPRRGVPQTFSLKAVDNLTVLSSGEQASGGTSQFWMRFIRGFRYEKLGIVSTLRNDTFTLNGTIHEGGVEYLVKKPALFGISVVNRMPDKVISFKEMTSRLKRVGQSEK